MVHSESKRKANNTNVSTTEVPQPPDGGYGWVIVIASFLVHIITDGIAYSLGVLYVALLADFNEGKGYTSSILSIMCGMTLCIGPVSSIFVNKYGCRVVTIAGAILASACFAVSFYAQNVLTLIITIGFGVGSGLGLIYLPSSITNIPEFKSQMQLSMDKESVANRLENGIEPKTKKICGCIPADSDAFLEMLNFDLLTDPIFVIYALSNFFTCLGFHMPYFCLADKAKGLGISATDASYLVSIVGVANTLGRIFLGYISDKPWTNRRWVYNGCLLTCGLATAGSVFCLDFWSLAVYSGTYGFFIGAYVSLTSVILVDLLGIGKLTNAFGLLLLFQGIGSFIGPPTVGFLFDKTQSYVPGFLFTGVMIALSGLMLFFIPTLQRYLARRQNQRADNVMNTIVDEQRVK